MAPIDDNPVMTIILAADIGGTVLRAAVGAADGSLRARLAGPSRPEDGPESLVERLVDLLDRVREMAGGVTEEVAGVVLAGPGPLSPARGELLDPIAPFDWRFNRYPLAARVGESLRLPVRLERDTVAAARGEAALGAARACRDFVYVTISTGVGAAVVSDGMLLRGADGLAGELGHMPATELDEPCPCGASGHLEAIAGGYAIGRIGTREGESGRSAALAIALRANAGRPLTAADVAAIAEAGDPVARAIVERAREAVAAAVVGYVNAFNPSLLVVGGAIARAGGEAYVAALRTAIDAHAFPTAARRVEVLPAALGDDAGLIGAAVIGVEFEA